MSTIPNGITELDLHRYAKMRAQLDKVLPIYKELESKIKTAYVEANPELTKTKTIIVDEINGVVKLTAKTKLDAAEFEENVPFENDENKKYYKITPNTTEIQKDFGKTYYEADTPSFSFAISE